MERSGEGISTVWQRREHSVVTVLAETADVMKRIFESLRNRRRIRCQCNHCGKVWKIPQRRIQQREREMGIEKGEVFTWPCTECFKGTILPESYTNCHGQEIEMIKE